MRGESEALARAADPARQVYLVPAFTGLGAPYWDADARGALFGLTRDVGRAEIARATLDAACFQTRDLLEAMRADGADPQEPARRRRHGRERLADAAAGGHSGPAGGAPAAHRDHRARGRGARRASPPGLYPSLDAIAAQWALDRSFEPGSAADERDSLYAGWQDAVRRTLSGRNERDPLRAGPSAGLGESPVWDGREGALYWIDGRKPSINRFDPVTSRTAR